MEIDTGVAVSVLYVFLLTIAMVAFTLVMALILFYTFRAARDLIQYAIRRWWRW